MVWGSNTVGQVGNGTEAGSGCYCVDVPVAVNGLSGVTQIDGGYRHALALLDNGTVMAWGGGTEGQLGDGAATKRLTPVPVPGLSNVVAISAGEENSVALLADGSVMAWGDNEYGSLGDGGSTGPDTCAGDPCSKVPVPVPGVSNVIAISTSQYYSLALRADGTVLGWGSDSFGQLGDGVGVSTGCECVPTPTSIPGLSGVVAISAGERTASALLSDGTMRTWGFNKKGQLGTGVESPPPSPCTCLGPTSPVGVSGVRQVASGEEHGLALLSNGAVQGWGANDVSQVGLGFASPTGCRCVPLPTTIPGLAPAAVAAGYAFSLALLPDGTGLAWGDGYYGELGGGESDGSVEKSSPTPILSLAGASELAASETNSFAVIGPKQTLNVALAGAGAGKVGGNGIVCPPSCTGPLPQGQVEALRAEPDPGTGFAGFSGPCTGTGACQVKMSADQTVTATFGPPKGTTITSGKIKGKKKKKATFKFSAPGAITGYQCLLIKPKPRRKGKKKRAHNSAKKGKAAKPKFSACAAPKAYKNLRPGRYTFKVRALDILGADANPATRTFKVKKAKRKKKHRA